MTAIATDRTTYANQRTNLRLADYSADLAAIRAMPAAGIDSNVVRFALRLVTENAAAELVRLERFGRAGAS